MQIRLDGKVALVTGASRGLGKAMATRFLESGADVALIARRPDVLEQTRRELDAHGKGKVVAFRCDVARADQIASAFEATVAALGRVDILVNNAGTSIRGPFESIDDATWQLDLDLKLFAAIRLSRLALPGMKSRRWGRILNVLNTAAKAPPAETAPTSVTRAAGMALTKVLSKEGAPHNVLVNALCTGLIHSDQWVRRHKAEAGGQPYGEFAAAFARDSKIPLGRLGEAEEFANLACFLASDAGGYITGTAINVDGGLAPVV